MPGVEMPASDAAALLLLHHGHDGLLDTAGRDAKHLHEFGRLAAAWNLAHCQLLDADVTLLAQGTCHRIAQTTCHTVTSNMSLQTYHQLMCY